MSDEELVAEVKRLVGSERETTARLVAHLAELDARRLHLGAGFPSLFVYCTTALRLSENEAYNRIEAARTASRFPGILGLLGSGSINLTTIRLLAPHLREDNHEELLSHASGRSKREVEEMLAARFPQPAVPSSVRRLPEARLESASPAVLPIPRAADDLLRSAAAIQLAPAPHPQSQPSRRAVVAPLARDQYRITFTANAELHRKLRMAQDLLRHQVPDGDPARIFDRALSALLEDVARKNLAATGRPRPSRGSSPGSRHIPAEVKRTVWLRDGGRCGFVATNGRRCREGGLLEFHHVKPYAEGGPATVGNIELRCRPHNGYEADLHFGPRRREGEMPELVPERVPGQRHVRSRPDATSDP
jgi:hypothetical protein